MLKPGKWKFLWMILVVNGAPAGALATQAECYVDLTYQGGVLRTFGNGGSTVQEACAGARSTCEAVREINYGPHGECVTRKAVEAAPPEFPGSPFYTRQKCSYELVYGLGYVAEVFTEHAYGATAQEAIDRACDIAYGSCRSRQYHPASQCRKRKGTGAKF